MPIGLFWEALRRKILRIFALSTTDGLASWMPLINGSRDTSIVHFAKGPRSLNRSLTTHEHISRYAHSIYICARAATLARFSSLSVDLRLCIPQVYQDMETPTLVTRKSRPLPRCSRIFVAMTCLRSFAVTYSRQYLGPPTEQTPSAST